jgi:hypothetical protein
VFVSVLEEEEANGLDKADASSRERGSVREVVRRGFLLDGDGDGLRGCLPRAVGEGRGDRGSCESSEIA